MKYRLTVSIVLFKSDRKKLNRVIDSVYSTTVSFRLFLVDNSPTDDLRDLVRDERTEYVFNNANIGFGRAHNIAMRQSILLSDYHLVLNPDVFFGEGVLEKIVDHMDQNQEIGQVMPKILYPNGDTQYLCKLLPAPADLFLRRFFPWFPGAAARNLKYELRASGYNREMNIPYLSGCFMFFRTGALSKVGLFDERIFMYIEDADLTRRMHQQYKTVFYPNVVVHHHYDKGSYKSLKLMAYNIHGAIIYFSKWGWIFDAERKKVNETVIKSYIPKA